MSKVETDNLNSKIHHAVSTLEQRTLELMKTLKTEGRKAEATAQEHVWVTALSALGIGLVIGLLFGFFRR